MQPRSFNAQMQALPEPPDGLPPFWTAWRHQLWAHGQADDPNNFMSWPCVYHTMLVRHWDMQERLDYLCALPDWPRWDSALTMPEIGSPPDYHRDTPYSANLIEQAYHLAKFEQWAGVKVEELHSVMEFGAGYGAMALLVHRLGFRGDYAICDLPEFRILQQWFLGEMGVPARWAGEGRFDLLIACYSISEVQLRNRRPILRKMPADRYLFLYSEDWAKMNNTKWFKSWRGLRRDYRWRHEKVCDRPDHYLFGTRGEDAPIQGL